MLELLSVDVNYGKSEAVKDISLEVRRGELVCIIGANGAGKTTIMKAIMGLVEVAAGSINFDGYVLNAKAAWHRAELGIGYVPEGRRVFGELTVEENLRMGCYKTKGQDRIKTNIDKVYHMFPRLAERKKQLSKTMSGGEQQMLAIGRALVSEPRLLLIDEISMGLMPILVDHSFEIIQKLNDEGITVLLVEQNAHKALGIASRGYVLETGKIVMHDTADNLWHNDAIKRAYLG